MTGPDNLPQRFVVAIDGPAGSGKSTIAKKLADTLGAVRIDSGAMYRAVTAKAIDEGMAPSDEKAVAQLAANITILFDHESQRVIVDGTDMTDRIRQADVNSAVSQVSANEGVRKVMVTAQREMGSGGRVVMEGRDIGSHVFPNADIKFFLTADESTRAQRRKQEMENAGQAVSYDEVLGNISSRDRVDSSRASSPLVQPEDAIEIDTTDLGIDEVLDKLIDWLVCRCANRA